MRRAIVTVATGNRADSGKKGESWLLGSPFSDYLDRWESSFRAYGGESALRAFRELPSGCPAHLDVPYAFKPYAIEAAAKEGFESILWADSVVMAFRPLAPLWDYLERTGYWFFSDSNNNCGQWACDAALPLLGITREEAFGIPQINATAFALDLKNREAAEFFSRYSGYARNGAYRGPWVNDHGEASPDPRVLGHRHDQTAASVIVHRMGLKRHPEFFYQWPREIPETLLKSER